MTKKEALKNAIKAIIMEMYGEMHTINPRDLNHSYVEKRANEIIKEVEIRFPMGDD